MTPTPIVAFLFTSSRAALLERVAQRDAADTPLYGMNYIPGAVALDAQTYTLMKLLRRPWLLSRLWAYDIIIAQDNFLLGFLVSRGARLFGKPTQWWCLNMTLSNLLRRHVKHPIRSFLLMHFWRSYGRILCLCEAQREALDAAGLPKRRLSVVPFGVDAAFFAGDEESSRGEEEFVLSVGRDAGRDYETLCEAIAGTNYPLVIVAGSNNSLGKRVPPQSTVRADVDIREIRDLYRRARVVVVPSRPATNAAGSDCSGQTVILDALAAGKAVIVTERSWIREYFTVGEDLIVVPAEDEEALRSALSDLWEDVALRHKLATHGRATVVSKYTTKHFASRLRELMQTAS